MISSILLRNFKCFENQRLDLGGLTLLTGLNGTGKSSVLQSFLLLRQSFEQGLLLQKRLSLNGGWVQLGTARDVFYESAKEEDFGFDLDLVQGQRQLSASWRFVYDRAADVVSLSSNPVDASVYTESLFGDDFQYISAERCGPRTSYPVSDYQVKQHRQLGLRGEFTAQFLGEFGQGRVGNPLLAHQSEKSLSLQSQVEAWMGEISPGVRLDIHSYPEIDAVSLLFAFATDRQVSNWYRATNVGFGITYTLPIVVGLLASKPGSLVLIENPEAHLHPRGQVKMGELMARAASAGVQVIVESHSDHILNGVRIAVRERILTPQQTRFYYFERGGRDDQLSSHVTSPNIDADGRIDDWPEGFFDEWERSLLRLL